jgi:hypothetical protein
VPDDLDARLVILGVGEPFTKEADAPALVAAKEMLDKRGSSPRLCKNTLVFLAVDKTRLAELDESVRRYLAWQSIVDEAETLDLSPHQKKQAGTQRDNANGAVTARLPESYQWLLSPQQLTPQEPVSWQSHRLTGQEPLAVRASKKLKNEESLLTKFAATRLRHELDKVPLWRGQHVEIKLLTEDFARYLYLPRLRDTGVLIEAIRDGLTFTTWDKETFAFAESYDEKAKRYAGLKGGQNVNVPDDGLFGMLVKPDIAFAQIAADAPTPQPTSTPTSAPPGAPHSPSHPPGTTPAPASNQPTKPKRFYGSVKIDAARMNRDAGQISQEVVQHLVGLLMADVEITIEIQATAPDGFPDNVVRTVGENCRTLKFTQQDFAQE